MSEPLARLGPYVVTELIGRGGMGAVYRARHLELDAERAVKILTGRPSATRVQRFLRETQVLARIQHPNVVGIHDAGQDPQSGCLYFAMDLVAGEPLNVVLERGRLEWERAMETAIALCDGVEALHEQGVIHRDLKPPNVMLGPDGPVVLDLGLARDVDPQSGERLTRTGALMGTPLYMAPEQESGSSVTPAADVFALGLIVLELLSGYARSDSGPLAPPPPPSRIDPSLPRALDGVLSRALARNPAERYRRAGELAAALRAVRDRPGLSRTASRWLGAAVFLAALAGVGVAVSALGPPASSEPAAATGTVAPSPGLDPALGRAALAAAEQVEDPAKRHDALARWLERYGDHPDAAKARAAQERARKLFPLAVLHRARGPGTRVARYAVDDVVFGLSGSGRVRRWAGEGDPHSWTVPSSRVNASRLTILPGGQASLVSQRQVLVFDPRRREPPRRLLTRAASIDAVCRLGDDRIVLASGDPGTIELCPFEAGSVPVRLGATDGRVTTLAASADASYLVVGVVKATVDGLGRSWFSLWDLRAGKRVRVQPMITQVNRVAFVPGSHRFLVANASGRVALFDPRKRDALGELSSPDAPRRKLDKIRFAHRGPVNDLVIANDRVVSAGPSRSGREGEWRLWALQEQRLLVRREHPEPILAVSLSADGARLLLSTRRGFEVWDARVE